MELAGPPDPERASGGSSAPEPRTRGFLFCDLRDYTAFVEAHGDAAAADLLERYRALVRAAVAAEAGAEVRTEGDSFYVVFPSASPAVRCGLAIVAAAAEASAETPERRIRVGVGIHAGESVEQADGYVGSAVNLAARVCAAAAPGEVLVTETVRGLVRTSLAVSFTPRGRPRLKGIAEPIALYRVTPGAAVVAGPPRLRAMSVAPRSLAAAIAVVIVIGGVVTMAGWLASQRPGASPRSSVAASGSAAASGATSVPPSAEPALTGRLAFIASQIVGDDPNPRWQLYVADAAGGDWLRMTELTDQVSLAAWSPDGRRLVYTVSGDQNLPPQVVEVATAPAATARPWPFATDVIEWQGETYFLASIDWSPSDDLVVEAHSPDKLSLPSRIFAVPADGSAVRLVTEPNPDVQSAGADDGYPSISPDGLTMAFVSGPNARARSLWAAAAGGTGRIQVTADVIVWKSTVDQAATGPSWSPDGSRLAFAGQEGPGRPIEIWTVDARGTNLTRLTDDSLKDERPAFSPDGRWIAWTREVEGQRQIWVMGADGSDPHPLIVGAPGEQLDLVGWAPDPG